MSDFLISFAPRSSSPALLGHLGDLYLPDRRDGWNCERPWGAAALTHDLIAHGQNWVQQNSWAGGWVGDIPGGKSLMNALLAHLGASEESLRNDVSGAAKTLAHSGALQHFDGSGAVFLAGPSACIILSDPMAGVQIYVARDPSSRVLAVGTHSDLVALISGKLDDIDPISLGDFLDTGTPCCPFTMFEGITELAPGQILIVNAEGQSISVPWWVAPNEDLSLRVEDAAQEYARLWRHAVEKRCAGQSIGVQLSGGMDSRVVMAAVPGNLFCTGLTFCDELNREARISREVAAGYGREWVMLKRDPEYLGLTAPVATRFTGCEGEWHHAHALGLTRDFLDRRFDAIFTGLFMDNNFKGYYAEDIVPVTRLRGLLPPRQEKRKRDYVQATSAFCKKVLRPEIQEARVLRRRSFYDNHFARGRQSEWEWLDGYPVSQASDNTGWFVERRVMPLRLPVYDRALVELALRIPAMMKVQGDFFGHAIVKVLGPGNQIPNANDGAKPGSGAVAKHLQRLARKTQRSAISKLEKLGWRASVQHSWHDYKHYWRTSPVIKSLLNDHADGLAALGAIGSMEAIRAGLTDPRLPWRQSYRLLQFALWAKNVRRLKESHRQQPEPIATRCVGTV